MAFVLIRVCEVIALLAKDCERVKRALVGLGFIEAILSQMILSRMMEDEHTESRSLQLVALCAITIVLENHETLSGCLVMLMV